jgi:pantetheine-phosphate adenylyltransferase
MLTAIFPGSFDPITLGHQNIVLRALPLFKHIVVAVGTNTTKKSMFTAEQRLAWARLVFSGFDQVEVITFSGLTADLCARVGASHIIRGLRNGTDHDYERAVALMNRDLGGIETIFLPAEPRYAHLSSTIVREIITNRGDVRSFLPAQVELV